MSTDDFGARSPYKYLLDDPNFRRFIQNIRRRSEDSGNETLRRFGMIDKRFHKLPKYFARMTTKRAKKFLLDMIEDFETKGGEDGGDLAGSYIQNYVKSINSWLEYNDISPPKKINVEGAVLKGLFSVHSSNYRIVYKLSANQRKIEIWAVEHRNRVYEEITRYVKSQRIVARVSGVNY